MLEPLSHCGARWLGEAPGHVPGAFLCRGLHLDDHDGFAELAHALHHVGRAWRLAIPEGDEHVACLRHVVVAAHTGAFPKALPISAKELMLDLMFPRPAVAEAVGAPGATSEDLGDTEQLGRQRATQELVICERARSSDDELHECFLAPRVVRPALRVWAGSSSTSPCLTMPLSATSTASQLTPGGSWDHWLRQRRPCRL